MNFEIIERKRVAKNLTISKLCRMAGIDRGTYYRALNDPENIKFSTATKLVNALALNAAEKAQVLN